MNFLATLFDALRELRPFRVVRSYQQAVRFDWRGRPTALGPGFWFCIPWLWEIEDASVVEQVIEIESQSATTSDDVPLCVKANLRYRITDFLTFYTVVHDGHHSLRNEARAHLHSKIRGMSYQQVLENQDRLEAPGTRRSLTATAKGWGAEVLGLELCELVKARHYRLLQDQPNMGTFE